MVSWLAAKFSTYDTELLRAAAYAASNAAMAAADDAATAATAATVSNASKDAAAFAAAAFAADTFAAGASVAPTSAATAYTAASIFGTAQEVAAFAADGTAIDGGASPAALAGLPLWPQDTPKWVTKAWADLKRRLLDAGDDWDVWTDWYEARLAGKRPWRRSLEIARATLPDELWEQGPKAVNAEIKRLIAAEKAKGGSKTAAEVETFDFFLSYSTRNEASAKKIGAVIEKTRQTFFAQYKDFGPGSNFVREMQFGLDNSERMVAVLAPDYEASDNCQAEWASFYNRDPSSSKRLIVPILIHPTPLNGLARQVVYVNIVGLSESEAEAKIREAIAPVRPRSKAEFRSALAEAASPKPVVNEAGQIDIARNEAFDKVVASDDLYGLPVRQCTLARSIQRELERRNVPKFLLFELRAIEKHLDSHGLSAPLGFLNDRFGVIEAEFSEEQKGEAPWTRGGIGKMFQQLFDNHQIYRMHFPLDSERDRLYRAAPIQTDTLRDPAFLANQDRLVEGAREAERKGVVTERLADGVETRREFLRAVASMPKTDTPADLFVDPNDRISPPTLDQRLLAQESGFWDAMLQRSANLGQIGSFAKDIVELLSRIWG